MPGWESIRSCTCKATTVASSSSSDGAEKCDPSDERGCPTPFATQAFAAVTFFGAVGGLAAGGSGPGDGSGLPNFPLNGGGGVGKF